MLPAISTSTPISFATTSLFSECLTLPNIISSLARARFTGAKGFYITGRFCRAYTTAPTSTTMFTPAAIRTGRT